MIEYITMDLHLDFLYLLRDNVKIIPRISSGLWLHYDRRIRRYWRGLI